MIGQYYHASQSIFVFESHDGCGSAAPFQQRLAALWCPPQFKIQKTFPSHHIMAFRSTAERQKQLKKGIDADESRRRREDTTIQIRKNKKEERMNQRRRMASSYMSLSCSSFRFILISYP